MQEVLKKAFSIHAGPVIISIKRVKITVWPPVRYRSLKRPSYRLMLISFTDHDDEARRHRCWTATLFRSSAADIMRIMLGVGVYLPIIACPLPGRTLAIHEGDT